MIFSFQVFGDFPIIFLILISGLISLWLENHTLYDFNPVKFSEVCLMTVGTVYHGEGSMHIWKQCVFHYCVVECSINVSWIQFSAILAIFLPTCSIYYWMKSVEIVSNNYGLIMALCIFILSSATFCQLDHFFSIYSENICFLIDMFRPFIFNVIIHILRCMTCFLLFCLFYFLFLISPFPAFFWVICTIFSV